MTTDTAERTAIDCKTRALELIQEHEGLELFPYHCPADKLTIGYGRNIEDCGISQDEAYYMLGNDIDECMTDLSEFPWWLHVNSARQSALLDMRYNLGATGFRKFQKMLAALDIFDYDEAAAQILDSQAGRSQSGLGSRYRTLSRIMKNGF